ncbi:MAG: glycosyltransferase family 9 protein [Bacteroidetes bacterium]|nr:glycosyltransferase family 9 protein [Bacteroidota bacterium]
MSRRILVIQTAFPGDAILTLPFIQKLCEFYNDALIDVVCIPSTAEIFLSSSYVNNVIVLDKRKKHKNIFSLLKFAMRLKKNNYQKVYSPHRSFRSSLLVLLSGIKDSTGFDISAMSFIYKNKIRYENKLHEVQRNLSLLGNNNYIKNWQILPEIKIEVDSVRKVDSYLKNIGNQKLAAIAPGSVWQTKKYPEEHYSEIIKYLINNDFYVILIGGTSDAETCERIMSGFDKGVSTTANLFSIVESIELLKNCEILICNDSAPTHMAMCADIPVVTIYCSTIPSFGFYPYNKKSVFVSYDELKCKPCGIHGHHKCPVSTFECGLNLSPAAVIKKIEELILQK